MDNEHIYMNTIQVVSPIIESKHHYYKLEVIRSIVLLINIKLSGSISYNLFSLQQHIN